MEGKNSQTEKQLVLMLGSNLGDKVDLLKRATVMIEKELGTVVKKSAHYETEPWGYKNQPLFINQLIVVHTTNKPMEVLHKTLAIEADLGRDRSATIKGGERLIDIDILFYDHEIVQMPDLIIPHPAIQDRNFVLVPLCEVMPDYVHPVLNLSIKKLLDRCSDHLIVKKCKI